MGVIKSLVLFIFLICVTVSVIFFSRVSNPEVKEVVKVFSYEEVVH